MPRRWVSIRGNGKSLPSKPLMAESYAQHEFDFAFKPRVKDLPENPVRSKEAVRTYKESEESGQGYRVPAFSNSSAQSTGGSTVHPSNPLATALNQPPPDSRLDGMETICQPSHKPLLVHTSVRRVPDSVAGRPGTSQSPHKRRWRKLSEVFRSGSDTCRDTPEHQPIDFAVKETKHQPPLTRTPWRDSTLPLPVQDDTTLKHKKPPTIDIVLVRDDEIQSPEADTSKRPWTSHGHDPSPQLQVQIPLTPLERFSVMFGDIHGGTHAESLFGRQTISTRDTSTIVEQDKTKRRGVLRRRATSPTSPEFESSITNAVTQNRRSSKYSLFPTTPIPAKSHSATSSPARNRRRSLTAPAELQLRPSGLTSAHVPAAQQPQETSECLPDIVNTALPASIYTERCGHKKSSSATSENEIFFDIKSFRGSSGVDGNHFEMTRPPSSIVQVARSKSNARKTARRNIASETVRSHNEAQSQELGVLSLDTSAQIDETIAMVESLVSPVSGHSETGSPASSNSITRNEPAYYPNDYSQLHTLSSTGKVHRATNNLDTIPIESLTKSSFTTDLDEPVHFDGTRYDHHLTSSTQPPPNFSTPSMTALKLKTSMESSCDPSQIRGTVIPLSKYAPSGVREELAQQLSNRPAPAVRAGRSKTENNINCNSVRKHPAQLQKSSRASSLPGSLMQDASSNIDRENATMMVPLQLNDDTAAIMHVNPTAEVNVARKVSLLRKQSAKIVEPRLNIRFQPPATSEAVQRAMSVQHSKEGETKRRAKVDTKLPVVREVHHKLKPGCSIELLRSSAVTGSSSSSPQIQSVNPGLRSGLDKALPPIPVT